METNVVSLFCVKTTLRILHDVDNLQRAEREVDVDNSHIVRATQSSDFITSSSTAGTRTT